MPEKLFTRWSPTKFVLTALGAVLLVVALVALVPLASQAKIDDSTPAGNGKHPFTVTSPAFKDGGRLPNSAEFGGGFGCNGSNIAPTIEWRGVPAGTKSFTATINDVDAPVAGGFHHWIVYNIPGSVRALHNNPPYTQGTNSFGTVGYGGPCPPPDGETHHYIFTVYALSASHIDGQALTFEQLLQAIANDVVGATSIVGTFSRG